MGIGSLVVGQVANAIGTAVLSGKVLNLQCRIDEVNAISIRARGQLGNEISMVAGRVDMNSAFDQSGQVMGVMSNDGRELHGVMCSIADNVLDEPSRREGFGIISDILEPMAAHLTPPEVQSVSSIMSKC